MKRRKIKTFETGGSSIVLFFFVDENFKDKPYEVSNGRIKLQKKNKNREYYKTVYFYTTK